MDSFHDRYPTDARITMPVRIEDTLPDARVRVTAATHESLTIQFEADAPIAPEALTVGDWYRLDGAIVTDTDTHDLRVTADTAVDTDGETVDDWLGTHTTSPHNGHHTNFDEQVDKITKRSDDTKPPLSREDLAGMLAAEQELFEQTYGVDEGLRSNFYSGGHTEGGSASQETIGVATGGGKDVTNFRDHITEGVLPQPDAITYEGLFYDYYFDTGHRQDRESLFYPTYAQAITDHPLTGEQEHYLSVGLASNLTEEMLERPPLDLMAVVDVSTSMADDFTEYYYDAHGRERSVEGDTTTRKIDAAQEALAAMTKHLRPEDRFGVVLYHSDSTVAKPIRTVQETDMDAIRDKLQTIKAFGGTNMQAGFEEAVTHLTAQTDTETHEREARVLCFTDAMPNEGQTSVDALTATITDAAAEGVHTTFIGVGIDANSKLVSALSGIRGANHYFMQSADEFIDRMVDEFPYMVTPLVYDLTLTVEGDGYDIDAVYGSPNADATTGDVMHVETLFPSPSEDGESRGGVVLVKLAARKGGSEVRLSCSWEERDGTEDADVIRVDIPDTAPDHYDTPAIRKAVLLARYGTLLRDWLADAATASDDTSTDHGVNNGRPLNSHSPDDSDGGLNQWERQSTPLIVPDTYRKQFTAFRDHLAVERDAIADPNLEQELHVLDTLADA